MNDDGRRVFGLLSKVRPGENLIVGRCMVQTPDNVLDVADIEASRDGFRRYALTSGRVSVNHLDNLTVGRVRYFEFVSHPVAAVRVVLSIDNMNVWSAIRTGELAGLSIGGRGRWQRPQRNWGTIVSPYMVIPEEISVCRVPANADCHFEWLWSCGRWMLPPRREEQEAADVAAWVENLVRTRPQAVAA